MWLAAGRGSWLRPPRRNRLVREPNGQTAPPLQCRVIFRPVRNPIARLWNVMTMLGVVFERHGRVSDDDRGHPVPPRPRPPTAAGIRATPWYQLLPKDEHRQSLYLNNRAENSHRPTRRRERQMKRFKSPEQAQDFLSPHALIHGHFHARRYLVSINSYRTIRTEAFNIWRQETSIHQVE
jgi:hypothetical protein